MDNPESARRVQEVATTKPGRRTLRIRPVERASVLFWYVLFSLVFVTFGAMAWKDGSHVLGGVLLAVGLLFSFGMVHSMLGRSRFGESQLRLEFPVIPGQKVRGTISIPKRVADARHLYVEIRCVQVEWAGNPGSRSLRGELFWSAKDRFSLTRRGLSSECVFALDLARDVPYSTFSHEAVMSGVGTYWEIAAHADVPGVDYMRTFRIPVNGR